MSFAEFDLEKLCECGMDSRDRWHDLRHAEWQMQCGRADLQRRAESLESALRVAISNMIDAGGLEETIAVCQRAIEGEL